MLHMCAEYFPNSARNRVRAAAEVIPTHAAE